MQHTEIAWFFNSKATPRPTTMVTVLSALIGGWSHVLLDSVMHTDIQPWWPFSESNQILQIVSLDSLHWFCMIAGLAAGAIWIIRKEF